MASDEQLGYTALLPALSPEEYEALKADIKERGLQVPIEVDEEGALLDGAHRRRACEELGIEPQTVVRPGLDEQDKREHAIKQNLLRRQLGPVGFAVAAQALLEARGVKRGQGQRNDRTSATVAEVAEELGVSERTLRSRIKLAEDLAAHPDLVSRFDAREITAKDARGEVERRREAHRPRPNLVSPTDPMGGQPWGRGSKPRPLPLADIPAALVASERSKARSDAITSRNGRLPVPESNTVRAWRDRLAAGEPKPVPSLTKTIANVEQLRASNPSPHLDAALDALKREQEAVARRAEEIAAAAREIEEHARGRA